MTREFTNAWSSQDELGAAIGDMHYEFLANEKRIKGKKDNSKHSGKRSEVRRIQEAQAQVREVLKKTK